MTQEVEVVYDGEVVDEDIPSWEELKSRWATGASNELEAQLEQAEAAASVPRHYGKGSLRKFADELAPNKASKSKVYDYARAWWIFGHILSEWKDSGRLEGLLEAGIGISHIVECSYSENPVSELLGAEKHRRTVREITARRRKPPPEKPPDKDDDGNTIPSSANDKESHAKNVETIQLLCCPKCGEVFPMSEALVWSEERKDG